MISWHDIKTDSVEEFDSQLSYRLRKSNILYLVTDKTYGQLVDTTNFPKDAKHPELFRVFENFRLWQKRYILPKVCQKSTV